MLRQWWSLRRRLEGFIFTTEAVEESVTDFPRLCGVLHLQVYIISAIKDIFRGIKRVSSKYAASSVTEESQ